MVGERMDIEGESEKINIKFDKLSIGRVHHTTT
jgi:hypothetical protein